MYAIPVDDSTRVAEARRLALAVGEAEGLSNQSAEELAIIATEIATNLLKHSQKGELHLHGLSRIGTPGVEIVSIDRGPGMENVQACVKDGFSTAGTQGTGLGAVARLADDFDVFSEFRKGTVLVARKFVRKSDRPCVGQWCFAAVTVPYPGEQACGDNWMVAPNGTATSALVADGLGHGILAADASSAAVFAFEKRPHDAPAEILQNVHLALRSTRGAAVAVIRIQHDKGIAQYAGLGNIAGVLLGPARSQAMVSHNGTAGLEARRVQQFEYALPENAVLVMHSDGLTSSWSIHAYPGLLRRHPAVIAGVLYRDATRGRDDVCVLVGKRMDE